jgi:hypothetical protein
MKRKIPEYGLLGKPMIIKWIKEQKKKIKNKACNSPQIFLY